MAWDSARHFDTTPEMVLPLHSWFLETTTWFDDPRHLIIRHHSFGCYQEQRLGVVLEQPGQRPLPTHIVAERHIRTLIGRIPAAADFLRRIKGQPWMAAAQNTGRLGLPANK